MTFKNLRQNPKRNKDECISSLYFPLSCILDNGVCIEAMCEKIIKEDKTKCDAEKKRCFWSTKHESCYSQNPTIKSCQDINKYNNSKENCTAWQFEYLNCAWIDTKNICKPKKELVCSDFADSQKCRENNSMSCVWDIGPTMQGGTMERSELKKTGSCKPRSEARCESLGEDKNSCDAEKKRCFWSTKRNPNQCWEKDKKIIKCSQVKNSLCESWVYEYLNCLLIETVDQRSCKLKSEIKCKELNWKNCNDNSKFGYLKCGWLQEGNKGTCYNK